MKFETLITRYNNLGYTPKNVDEEIELELLINWIYKTYNIFIFLTYHDYIFQETIKKHIPKVNSFSAHRIWNCNTENSHVIYSGRYFREPYDAKFDTVRDLYRAIKVQFHLIKK